MICFIYGVHRYDSEALNVPWDRKECAYARPFGVDVAIEPQQMTPTTAPARRISASQQKRSSQ
ncbi:MAG: hypothetical protein A3G45_02950 [Candidatus Staskawiczbacteria bacterium RIFCSPLOWO2_12_FULL_37_15]|uniref:Uncharacterized protein n=1 Tax=Candidatus Staskawiczbacteria bacterium RIFCSPLOWO2_12_FULL_37_15 TaxID=1802218 RepID=A0A1G2IP33_9BACT|nr:MAG: hypothetical protein A3G45_02950 [Candidatus Staskawiczbacteria bacterium RIFCSPLOWO2_12_FULL_37_15]